MNARLDRYIHEVHLNLKVRGRDISPTLAINEISRRLLQDGRTVFRLGLGQSPFPVPEPVVQAFQGGEWLEAYLAASRKILAPLAEYSRNRLDQAGGAGYNLPPHLLSQGHHRY